MLQTIRQRHAILLNNGTVVPTLRFLLETTYDATSGFVPEFYIIPANLPYGIEKKAGELIICGDLSGKSVIIKAWRFQSESWEKGHPERYPEENGNLVEIRIQPENPKTVQMIKWTPPGVIETFRTNLQYEDGWEKVVSYPEPFRNFITRVSHQ
jgi:hypothetical protein